MICFAYLIEVSQAGWYYQKIIDVICCQTYTHVKHSLYMSDIEAMICRTARLIGLTIPMMSGPRDPVFMHDSDVSADIVSSPSEFLPRRTGRQSVAPRRIRNSIPDAPGRGDFFPVSRRAKLLLSRIRPIRASTTRLPDRCTAPSGDLHSDAPGRVRTPFQANRAVQESPLNWCQFGHGLFLSRHI